MLKNTTEFAKTLNDKRLVFVEAAGVTSVQDATTGLELGKFSSTAKSLEITEILSKIPDKTPTETAAAATQGTATGDANKVETAVATGTAAEGTYAEKLLRYKQLFKDGQYTELFAELEKTTAFPKMGATKVRNLADMEADYIARYGADAKNFPYLKTAPITDFTLDETGYFVRVYSGTDPASRWIFRIEDLRKYSSVDELMEKLALPIKPTKIGLVEVPAGTILRKSTAGAQDWVKFGLKQSGGGIQYEIVNPLDNNWFKDFSTIDVFFK